LTGILFSCTRTALRLAFPPAFPRPAGVLYYTGVGYKNVGCIARKIVEEHIDICIAAGINIEGINAEVAKGQWDTRSSARIQEGCRSDVGRPLHHGAHR